MDGREDERRLCESESMSGEDSKMVIQWNGMRRSGIPCQNFRLEGFRSNPLAPRY